MRRLDYRDGPVKILAALCLARFAGIQRTAFLITDRQHTARNRETSGLLASSGGRRRPAPLGHSMETRPQHGDTRTTHPKRTSYDSPQVRCLTGNVRPVTLRVCKSI